MEIQAIGIQFLTDEEDDEDKMDMGGHTTTEEAEPKLLKSRFKS